MEAEEDKEEDAEEGREKNVDSLKIEEDRDLRSNLQKLTEEWIFDRKERPLGGARSPWGYEVEGPEMYVMTISQMC